MIKLIASDLDGTLLKEGTMDINPEIYDIIRKLKAKGIVAIEVVIILFSALILVYGGSVITTMNMLQYDSILKIPTGTIYSIIPVCGVLIIFYSIYNLTVELNKKEGGE